MASKDHARITCASFFFSHSQIFTSKHNRTRFLSCFSLSAIKGDWGFQIGLVLKPSFDFPFITFQNAIIFRRTWKRDSRIISLIGVICNFNCIQFTIFITFFFDNNCRK